MSGPLRTPKTFAQKASMIHTAQLCQRENAHLLNELASSGARQEVILERLKENEKIIKRGEEELEDLIAIRNSAIIKAVYQFTADAGKRAMFINEGRIRVRNMLSDYDYSNVTHFNEDLQRLFADFSVYMERS